MSRLPAAVGLALALLACVVPAFAGAYWIGVGIALLSWIALTESWVVFSGMTGYVSLGHAVFFGLGAYIAALFWQDIDLWLLVPLAGLTAVALALLVGWPSLRVRGPYFVILTFGIAEFVKYVVVAIEAALGSTGRLLLGTPLPEDLYYAMLALAVAATLITALLGASRFGAGLRAIREDEVAAATLGVPVTRYKLAAFAISAFIPGMVGAVWALRATYFEPLQLFSPITSFTIVSMAIIGGSDRAAGPLLGCTLLTVLSELLWARAPQFYLVLVGALLVGFVLFVPQGMVDRLTPKPARA
jgi:branched-chain amino acid transport system permease protein